MYRSRCLLNLNKIQLYNKRCAFVLSDKDICDCTLSSQFLIHFFIVSFLKLVYISHSIFLSLCIRHSNASVTPFFGAVMDKSKKRGM